MGIEENENMGFDHQHRSSDDTLLKFPSSVMNTNPVSLWDPIVSLSQSENFGASSVIPHSDFGIGNQGMVHYQTLSDFGGMVPKLSCFGNGSLSEMVSSFGLTDCGQISTMGCPQNYSTNGGICKGEQQVSEDGGKGKSPCGKGIKRGSESNSPQSHSKGEQWKEMSVDSPEHPNEHDEKRQKIEHNLGTTLRGKQTGKQVKDGSNNDDSAKENYIHVRAKRGYATNSHSLAERVRRERISERMRLLQDLVPGCNKITGKAVMLDEIINYVQSLQQQVEFLSMKLATVDPELNIDIDRILSKELQHLRGDNIGFPGFGPSIHPPNPYPPIMSQGPLPRLTNASPFHQMPQNMWDSDIQSLLQMGFESNPLGSSGRPKFDP